MFSPAPSSTARYILRGQKIQKFQSWILEIRKKCRNIETFLFLDSSFWILDSSRDSLWSHNSHNLRILHISHNLLNLHFFLFLHLFHLFHFLLLFHFLHFFYTIYTLILLRSYTFILIPLVPRLLPLLLILLSLLILPLLPPHGNQKETIYHRSYRMRTHIVMSMVFFCLEVVGKEKSWTYTNRRTCAMSTTTWDMKWFQNNHYSYIKRYIKKWYLKKCAR